MPIILPVGISFYTFHAISYVVDVYRGKVEPEPSFANIALYISFFPQLIAGPIVGASFIMPQIRRPRSFSPAQQSFGVLLLLRGFIYKAAIADTMAQIADPVSAHVDRYDGHALLTATIAFYGQIYFDFAGYFEHGDRHRPAVWLPLSAELQLPLPRRISHRVLAALAYVAVILVTRLPLHPARRQPGR
jgi:D-alanyl-lipoteichoic acid acyltransferase DltB (MBOAT superfamily)